MTIALYNVHHLPPERPLGGIIKQVQVGPRSALEPQFESLSSRFASMRAYYDAWMSLEDPDMIGFQGYRKHINFKSLWPPAWSEVSKQDFYQYQDWLAQWDGKLIEDLLQQYEMIITPAFDLQSAGGMADDFCRSRSCLDWAAFMRVMDDHGPWEWDQPNVVSHWFMTTSAVFHRFMHFWWSVFSDLEMHITSADARDAAYPPRAFDYLTERFFTMWLKREKIKTITLPLMICWDAK
jgi:hypothetical protein